MSWPRFKPKTSRLQELYHYTKLLLSYMTYYSFKTQWYLYVPLTLSINLPSVFRIISSQLFPANSIILNYWSLYWRCSVFSDRTGTTSHCETWPVCDSVPPASLNVCWCRILLEWKLFKSVLYWGCGRKPLWMVGMTALDGPLIPPLLRHNLSSPSELCQSAQSEGYQYQF
jgi:hypothetical protein